MTLFTIHYSLFIINYPLSVIRYPLSAVRYPNIPSITAAATLITSQSKK